MELYIITIAIVVLQSWLSQSKLMLHMSHSHLTTSVKTLIAKWHQILTAKFAKNKIGANIVIKVSLVEVA